MSNRQTRLQRGHRRGLALQARTLSELRDRRVTLGISQPAMSRALEISQSQLWRIESGRTEVSLVRLSEMASVLGREISIGVHDTGDPIRDKGQQALGRRFDAIPAPAWHVSAEILLPNPGDLRSWDRLLRLATSPARHLVGADLETRIRDVQGLVRRTRLRERDGGVDEILIVLSDSAINRRLVDELRAALGPAYATPPREILGALRHGEPLPGSGVILV